MGEYLQIIIIGIIAIIIFKLGFKGTLKAIISFALNLIVGLVLLYVINKYAILGLYIPVNIFTSLIQQVEANHRMYTSSRAEERL